MSIDLSDDECIHGLYPASSCSLCSGVEAARRRAEEHAPVTFPATYETICPGCRGAIRVGEIIAWKDGHRAHHEECWPT